MNDGDGLWLAAVAKQGFRRLEKMEEENATGKQKQCKAAHGDDEIVYCRPVCRVLTRRRTLHSPLCLPLYPVLFDSALLSPFAQHPLPHMSSCSSWPSR